MVRATFAGGCFWCTEAVFNNVKGVIRVVSGYTGGETSDPAYEDVSTGTTGHAETIQLEFDPKIISYENLLKIFFGTHDPTTKDRQGPDAGSQYRSVIFYHSEKQKELAIKQREVLKSLFDSPIVTEIIPFESFYEAEDYHQNYYEKNPEKMYCRVVISPKIVKLRKNFKKFLK